MSKTKVYLLIYTNQWEECPNCEEGLNGYPEILCIRFTKKQVEEYLAKRVQDGAKYLLGNTDIEEMEVE